MKKLLSIILVLAMVFSLIACTNEKPADKTGKQSGTKTDAEKEQDQPQSNRTESNDKKTIIGFSPYTLTNEYFSAVLNGVQQACKDKGCGLIYFDPENDPTKQASQIDDMIAKGIKALVYIPFDSAGARTVLQTCRSKGIKVVNIDNVISEEDYELVDAILASDNTQLGYLAGEWVVKHHPDGANILIVHLQTAESCIINVAGFWQAIKEKSKDPSKFIEVQVVEGQGATDASFNVVADALEKSKEIDVIYCINDTSALGAIHAAEEAGRLDQIDVLGKDGAPIGKHAIKEGKMVQSSAQRPRYMGYEGVITALKLLEDKEIEFNKSIESYSITKENVDQFDLDAWDSLE